LWHEAIVAGTITPQEAMDSIAEEWEAIFEKFGYYD
jgi:hypothetical protein